MNGRVAVLKAYGGDFERPRDVWARGAVGRRRDGGLGGRAEGDRVAFLYLRWVAVRARRAPTGYSPWALAQALAFLRRNLRRFPYERLVSHVFPLARIGEAFQQADWMQRAGDGLRISRAALSMAD
jgi:hypothetical protein